MQQPRLKAQALRATCLAVLLAWPALAQATHFRYGTYTWDRANLLSSLGASLNDTGNAVGTVDLPGGDARGFIFDRQSIQQLPALGGSFSEATAINAAGQAVGRTANAQGLPLAFIFQGNTMSSLGTRGQQPRRAVDTRRGIALEHRWPGQLYGWHCLEQRVRPRPQPLS